MYDNVCKALDKNHNSDIMSLLSFKGSSLHAKLSLVCVYISTRLHVQVYNACAKLKKWCVYDADEHSQA